MSKRQLSFDGFEPANTTPVPDVLFDELLPYLSEAELKVLLYIIRRTSGFKKTDDAISLSQFQNGITKRNGEILDQGCGVKNRTTISNALASLEKKGCIESIKDDDPQGDKATTVYRVRFQSDGVVRKTYYGSTQNVPPVVSETYHGSTNEALPVVRKTYPQETVIQETVKQLDSRQEESIVTSAIAGSDAPAPIDFTEQKKKRDTEPRLPAVSSHSHEDIGNEETVKMPAVPKHTPAAGAAIPPSSDTGAQASRDGTYSTPAQRSGASLAGIPASPGAVQASGKRKGKVTQADEPVPMPKSDTREIQRRINEHRGYALEEKVDIVRERQAIKTWCNLHTLEEYGLVMSGAKKDRYWGKQENYYRIGGLTLLKITPEILARQREPLPMVANGNGHQSDMEGLVSQNGLVLWQGQWMTEEEADKTGFNGGFGLYK